MEALVVGLVIITVSGLAILAYRHPYAYRIVGFSVMFLAGMWGMQAILWNYSLVRGSIHSLRKIAEENPDTPLSAFTKSLIQDDDEMQTVNTAWLLLLGAEGYLAFLLFLPQLLAHDKQRSGTTDLSEAVKLLKEIANQYKPVEPRPDEKEDKAKR